MRVGQFLAQLGQVIQALPANEIVEQEHSALQFGHMAGARWPQPVESRRGQRTSVGLVAQTLEQVRLLAHLSSQAIRYAGQGGHQGPAGRGLAPLFIDQAAEQHQVRFFGFVQIAPAPQAFQGRRLRHRLAKLDAIGQRAHQFVEHHVFCGQVFIKGLARVLDHQGEGARGAHLAARDVIAVMGLNVIGDAGAGREHGRGGLEQRGTACGPRALRVLERNSLLGSAVDPVHEIDSGKAIVVAGGVAHFHRPRRNQLQAIGRRHYVHLRRPVDFGHDAMGPRFAHRPPEERRQPNAVAAVFVDEEPSRQLAGRQCRRDLTPLACLTQQQQRFAG